ncbi:Crp/Fnr family transcriptional regulator [Actinacidiphila sp. ITFR-21]|uniref:Crp/Fnr family transcriptional regulator n=1 Tax=Actinacidiphila sp. ITFR-21 TaxID=3075199 RepID=UPI00288B8632|nr:Crp/Fnr family transcriptional regulator [Streptomyces sp. ITFR-21]WNI18917.1 Crp/Fnr family transcriptional regulator [Streptomyces sp. ITFR-21]
MRGDGRARPPARPGRPARAAWGWPARSLLASLGDQSRKRLLAIGTLCQFAPSGRPLMREGDTSTFVLILLDGVVKATGRSQDGKDALLAVRVGGDLVGELAAIDGQPRSATVTTSGTVLARVVKQADFLDCLRREPEVAAMVNRSVVGKLRAANARRIDLTGCDVPTRVARVLHDVVVRYGERTAEGAVLRWPLTQPELAGLAGAAVVTVNKVLRQLRADGVVSTGYRSVTVLDLDGAAAVTYP